MRRKYVDYYEYIQTDKWREKATAAKKRADWRCQICNRSGNYSTLAAHHRTYDRLGDEAPEDITVLCHSCHELYEQARIQGKLPRLSRTQSRPIYEPPTYSSPPTQAAPAYKPPTYKPPTIQSVHPIPQPAQPVSRYRKGRRARQLLYIVGFPLLIALLIFSPVLFDRDSAFLKNYREFFMVSPVRTPTHTPRPTATMQPTVDRSPTRRLTPPALITYTPTLYPTPYPTETRIMACACSRDIYDCENFNPRSSAQLCYDYCIDEVSFDIHQLDADNDGLACE